MLELVKAGGWPMVPLLLLGVIALAIVLERLWSLRRNEVTPPGLGEEVRNWAARGKLDPSHIESLRAIRRWAPCWLQRWTCAVVRVS